MPPAADRVAAFILVEGQSDREAVAALADRLGRNLSYEGVTVLPIGGAHAAARALASLSATSQALSVVGLCDAREAEQSRRAGIEVHVCDPDLEDELIRAVGPKGAKSVIEELGEARQWERFTRQPAQRGRPIEAQLHRFLGTHSGRKSLYARALVNACELGRMPAPLLGVLAAV